MKSQHVLYLILLSRCQCGGDGCVGYLGGHAKSFQAALVAEAAAAAEVELDSFDDTDGSASSVDCLSDFGSEEDGLMGMTAAAAAAAAEPRNSLQSSLQGGAQKRQHSGIQNSDRGKRLLTNAAAAVAAIPRQKLAAGQQAVGSVGSGNGCSSRRGKRKRAAAASPTPPVQLRQQSAPATPPAPADGSCVGGNASGPRCQRKRQRPNSAPAKAAEVNIVIRL